MFDWWKKQKELHESSVREFFKDKVGQFVEIDIKQDDVLNKLRKMLHVEFNDEWKHIAKSPKS